MEFSGFFEEKEMVLDFSVELKKKNNFSETAEFPILIKQTAELCISFRRFEPKINFQTITSL
jgi:hypothetical protein